MSLVRRSGLLFLSFVFFASSLHAAVVWHFKDAQFADGGTIAGSFTWEPGSFHISDWNVQVAGGSQAGTFPARSYTPANSQIGNDQAGRGLYLRSTIDTRILLVRAVPQELPADGGVVAISVADGDSFECLDCAPFRTITRGSLEGTSQFDVYLPISGSVLTGSGQFFRSNVRILNLSEDPTTAEITYLPAGSDNSGATPTSVSLGGRDMHNFDDIVGTTLGKSGLGALRIRSTQSALDVTENIFTDSLCAQPATGGVFGQFAVGMRSSEASSYGVLLHLRADAEARTNLGFVNPNGASATVIFSVVTADGGPVLTSGTINLPPYGMINPTNVSVLANAAVSAPSFWVEFSSTLPVLGYASVVDNGSGDQYYVPAIKKF